MKLMRQILPRAQPGTKRVAQLFGRRPNEVAQYQDQIGQIFFHEKSK